MLRPIIFLYVLFFKIRYVVRRDKIVDCDLRRHTIPTIIQIRVIPFFLKFFYPEGVWKGLCETCPGSAQKLNFIFQC
ncbi:MAG: F420H2 dehydrogenase subunit FpoO [Methanosarcina sp.]